MTAARSQAAPKRVERVEIPAYTDRWMMGDRFGEVVGTVRSTIRVRLDKSGKVVRVLADDCRFIEGEHWG